MCQCEASSSSAYLPLATNQLLSAQCICEQLRMRILSFLFLQQTRRVQQTLLPGRGTYLHTALQAADGNELQDALLDVLKTVVVVIQNLQEESREVSAEVSWSH